MTFRESTFVPSPPRRANRGAFLASVFTTAIATLTFNLATFAAEPAVAVAAAPRVTVTPVEVKLVTEYEELTGRIDAIETVELRARVSGHVDAVRFQAGQLVEKGQVLFTIDPRWYQAQFDLAQARADVAGREAHRAEELLAAAAIASEEVESRRAKFAAAQAELATARLDLEHTEVRAPIAGRIGRALITPGNLVSGAPGSATSLATIVSTGNAYVYADLDESTLLKFNRLLHEKRLATQSGRVPVDLQLADENDYPRHGFIESADNHVNPETGSLVLRMVFPNEDDALIPGLFARVRVPVSAPQDTLLVSERAIGTDQSQKFVLAVDQNNVVTYRTVKLGATVDGKRAVRTGLKAGDRIIVSGLQRVRPGMTVAPELEVAAAPSGAAPAKVAAR